MDNRDIKSILLDIPNISNITEHVERTVHGRTYQYAFNCDLLIHGDIISVIICVPYNWEQELIHIYIRDTAALPFMPHIDDQGKICLFDLEGILIDINFEGILKQCVERAVQIIDDGLNNNNEEEFVREFSSYWSCLPGLLQMKVSLQDVHSSHIIKYIVQEPERKQGQTYAKYISTFHNMCFYGSDHEDYLNSRVQGQQRNGLFCYIPSRDFILPPDFRRPLSLEYINQLLLKTEPPTIKISKCLNSCLIVFNIHQPNGAETFIAVTFRNGKLGFTLDGRFVLQSSSNFSLLPIDVMREDKPFLVGRTNGNLYGNKKILLIGCGSIGGYMCNELIKAGLEDVTLVDNDRLKAENIYRHFLGMEYVDQYKAEALCRYFERNIPNTKIKALDEDIQESIENGDIELSEYDLIISATGNHNVNRFINREIHESAIDTPVIYAWNEPLDIGCHVAVISRKYKGCYECFFKRNKENDELYDAVAYAQPGQNFAKSLNGCSGSYIPYGSTVSLRATSIGMDWTERILNNRFDDNYLISYKGEGYYFTQAGYNTSSVYEKQLTEIMSQCISEITGGKGCNICGGCNDF